MSHEHHNSQKDHEKHPILVGVAWPYANGKIHLGHVAGSLLSPDIFARYHRMIGNDVLMISGSDEHGTPITVRAEEEGRTPQDIVDLYHKQTKKDLSSLWIDFDLFTRTTHPNHHSVVKDMFTTLYNQDYIYPKTTSELFCTECVKFLPDRYVTGTCPFCNKENARGDQCDECGKTYNAIELLTPACKICGSIPVPRETEHFFFRLPAFSDRLLTFLEDKDHWKSRVRNFTRNWIVEGLKDRPITRDISWGVPVPITGYESKRIYVWFDAVTGYLAASKQWASDVKGDPDAWKHFWLNPLTRSYYFLGKDNVPFHTIIWPSMLIGYSEGKHEQYDIPYDVPANEYLRLGGIKFTKSGGIGVDVASFMETYRSDEVRYYLSIIMPENRDVDFDMDEFRTHINNELVATFGNFIHRVLSFTSNNYEKFPKAGELSEVDRKAISEIREAGDRISNFIKKCEFKNGIKEIMALAAYGNRYLGERAPWHLLKTDRDACGTVLNTGLRIVKALSIFTYPYLPESMEHLQKYLGQIDQSSWETASSDFTGKQYAMSLTKPTPLFRVLEDPNKKDTRKEREMTNNKDGKQIVSKKKHKKKKKTIVAQPIDLEQVDLRVGTVLSATDHPNADKLYVFSIDVGDPEPRTLVAGLRAHYTPEELEGRNLVIVCNLKPAKLRGVVSQGMLLAAGSDDKVVFLTPGKDHPVGTPITGSSNTSRSLLSEITIDSFFSIQMSTRKIVSIVDGIATFDNGSTTAKGPKLNKALIQDDSVVVIANGQILLCENEPIYPERSIGPDASIR